MSEFLQRIAKLSPKRLALLALDLQTRLDAAERARAEQVAIIGIGCRFPGGANGPDAYWQLLQDRRDAISEVPRERWDIDSYYDPDPDAPGKMATRCGGFIDGIDQFDPQLFGISPREAASMDPQQRLLLEVAWEALEHAGHAPDRLAQSQTGVFIGLCNADYLQILLRAEGGPSNTYLATGSSHSVASGRLSYVLGLRGPSLSIDTACSSSLVAVHVACQSLLNGDCRTAIAGGVNAVLEPMTTIALSTARMMAPDGRCKAFDAAADGFVRAEGCGIVVLKRLSDAIADRDRVIAVIAGSAVNQDGRSNGLTAPNGKSQEAVLRAALARAGRGPHEIDYVEAHGTGTSLGDPIEVRALAAAFGERPAGRPLLIGSVKTNLGHLEAAAGMAGLIKTALSLEREEIPGQIHLRQLNPHLPWDRLPIDVVTQARPWPRRETPRFAGVSSFGFSGTNAHVILGEAPAPSVHATSPERPLHIAVVSARTTQALRQSADRLAQHLAGHAELSVTDACFTSNVGRAQLAHRAALVVSTMDELRDGLRGLADGAATPRTVSGYLSSLEPPPVAFLFTGQGSQYAGMGRQLYDTQPVFRRAIDACADILGPSLADPLQSVLWGEAAAKIDETRYTQPALFSLEYALSELWKSWGVVPALAVGHSLGEYVAACVASVFSLEDALKLVAARARLMQALPSGGAMASIGLSEQDVAALLVSTGANVSVAAVNGPDQTVISGAVAEVERVVAEASRTGARVHRLTVSHAFHSSLIEPMLDEFEAVASEVRYAPPRFGVVSNLTGALAGPETLTSPKYWRLHARQAVRFADGIRTLRDQGCRLFLEVGPSPVLLGLGRTSVDGEGFRWLPSLRKGRGEWDEMLQSLCAMYIDGVQIDWAGFDGEYARRRVALPTYPFARESYWIESASPSTGPSDTTASRPDGVSLLRAGTVATRIESARGEIIYQQSLGIQSTPNLADHRIDGRIAVPAGVYIAMAARAAMDFAGPTSPTIRDVSVTDALTLDDGAEVTAQVIVSPPQHGEASWEVFTRDTDTLSGGWTRRASGVIELRSDDSAPAVVSGARGDKKWLYGIEWREDARDGAAPTVAPGISGHKSFIVIGGQPETARVLTDAICARGDHAESAVAGATALTTVEAASTLLSSTLRSRERVDGVVYVAGAPESAEMSVDALSAEATHLCRDVLHLTQALAANEGTERPRMWIVTTRVQLEGDGDVPPTGASLWGLGRTIAMEHPEIWGGLIDVDSMDGAAEEIARVIAEGSRREEVALRGRKRYVSRLAPVRTPTPDRAVPITADATYLVTGGSGGIGIRVAEWLVERGATHLVLVSRRATPPPDVATAVDQLIRRGADVRVRQGDVTSLADMQRTFEEIRDSMPPLRGVIHSAGVVDDRVLLRHDAERFARVLAPKVTGSWVLHLLTRSMALDFFVMFSSAASLFAPVGQGNYAAANAFLDALAHHRRALGLPAVSINWAAWERTGMAAVVGERRETQWAQGGLALMTPAEGLDVLGWLLHGHLTQVAVLPVEWRTYFDWLGEARAAALLDAVKPDAKGESPAVAESFAERLLRLPAGARVTAVSDLVTAEVRTVLGFRSDQIVDPTQGLFDLGMDSLTAVELRNRLQNRIGRTIAGTVVFDHPSIDALTKHVGEVVVGSERAAVSSPVSIQPQPSRRESGNLDDLSEEDLAVMLAQKLGQLR
jgi:acyl transferase domain-containing protein/acyl carrier protein